MLSSFLQSLGSKLKQLSLNRLLINVAIVGGVTMAIKIVSFYKETLVASTFGLSILLDTFLIAVLIPSFIQNVFIGALRNIFIPNYITEISTTKEKGSFQAVVFGIVAIIMLFFCGLTYLLSDVLIENIFPNKQPEFYHLVRKQLYIILPSLFFMGYSSILGGLLEIKGKFLISTLAGIFPALSTILSLLFLHDLLGETVLAFGFLMGAIASFCYNLIAAIKLNVIRIAPPKLNPNSKIMIRQLPAKVTSGFLTGINPMVDQYFAGQMVIGSISALSYGVKIPAFISAIIIIAIGNVILPHFSKLVNQNRNLAFKQLYKILRTLFITVIVVVGILILLSHNIVELIFERDNFTNKDTEIVSLIMQIFLVYVPFRICSNVMVKFLTSINENSFMAYTSIFSLLSNIILNIILIKKYGLYGLAMSTTLVHIMVSCIFLVYIRKLSRNI